MDESPKPFPAQGPVDWALGKVLVATALKPILYSVLPDRVDPRDWMQPEELELKLEPSPEDPSAKVDDYWFDFVADTGDSDVGTYCVSYLFHGDLHVGGQVDLGADRPKIEAPLAVETEPGGAGHVLPRGQFLFVGGDSAYPVAEAKALLQRFVRPMNHAWEQRFPREKPATRPLLGIPGNHDWYDSLDGYNRIFRRLVTEGPLPSEDTSEPLLPRGHTALQQTSYFALTLPGDWEFWALDARDGPDMDHRQRAYFQQLAQERDAAPTPRNVLLATPNPAFVNGKRAAWVAKLCANLPATAVKRLALWFSGDTHHYARYERVEVPNGPHITSLVSGLGGAALHAPLAGGTKANALYPSVPQGEAAILRRLLNPFFMVRRIGLSLLGSVLGVVLGASGFARPAPSSTSANSDVSQVLSVPDRVDVLPEQQLVLLVTVAALVWLVIKLFKGRKTEKEARKKSTARRWLGLVAPLLLLGVGIVLASQGQRSFGRVLLGFNAVLAASALLVAIPLLLATGLPKSRRTFPRVASLVLAALAFGGVTIVGAIVAARAASLAFQGQCETTWPCQAARSLAPPLFAGVTQLVTFPVLAGFLLAFAFWCGAQRAFVSSFACVDRYLAFIRFRLRVERETDRGILTGFVVAVADGGGVTKNTLRAPKSAADLRPRAQLIDIFTVAPEPSPSLGANAR